jgi:hypothetical protein
MSKPTIQKVVERYKITFDHGPDDMYVEVYEGVNGFFAECNYSLWTKKQDAPWHHRHPDLDMERAVSIVISSITPDPNMDLESFCWVPFCDDEFVILGTGDKILKTLFKKK